LPSAEYRIGPGDNLNIFVWRNPELTVTVPVRPDGRVSIPLVEDVVAIGKTPTALAREYEQRLNKYIKEPLVTVIVERLCRSNSRPGASHRRSRSAAFFALSRRHDGA
jgi:protein involved in polysaccharide export with SLBB domain